MRLQCTTYYKDLLLIESNKVDIDDFSHCLHDGLSYLLAASTHFFRCEEAHESGMWTCLSRSHFEAIMDVNFMTIPCICI